MNKKETAKVLGVSIRLVERYASEGRLGAVKYVRGKTGKTADYAEDAVNRLKKELEEPIIPGGTSLTKPRTDAQLGLSVLQQLLENTTPEQTRGTGVRISEKLMLSPKEAARLSNLPQTFIRESIKDGKLPARKIGRSWKIKRQDLDEFIQQL